MAVHDLTADVLHCVACSITLLSRNACSLETGETGKPLAPVCTADAACTVVHGKSRQSLPRPFACVAGRRVKVFSPVTCRLETSELTDPYSRATTADGARTLFVDLAAEALTPAGWHDYAACPVERFTDITVYELHVRDFSATDESVPEQLRGTYRAFCPQVRDPGLGLQIMRDGWHGNMPCRLHNTLCCLTWHADWHAD